MNKKYDAIVIGGGYPGCAISYYLSKNKLSTLLIEQKEISSGASGANFGQIQVQDASLGLSLDLTMHSFKSVMSYEKILDMNLDLRKEESTIVAVNDAEMKELEELYMAKKEAGLDISLLDRKGLKEVEPNINEKEFLGATYFVQGSLNPFKLMYGFIKRGRENGLEVKEKTKVESLYMESGKVKGVILSNGETIFAENVIVAAGAWTKELCKSAGILVPIEYVRAEAFVTEKIKPFLKTDISSASFFTEAHGLDEASMSLCIYQTKSGEILIGETSKPGTVKPDEASRLTSLYHNNAVRDKIGKYFPALKDINILRSWTTVSPYTDTMEPVLGKVGVDGLLVASGFKSCVIMTAVAGEIISDLILKGDTFCDLSGFNSQVKPL